MNKNYDMELEEFLNEDTIIPDTVQEKINDAFKEIKNTNSKPSYSRKTGLWKKTALVAAGVLLMLITIFREPVMAELKSLFGKAGADKGIDKAVESGYIQTGNQYTAADNGINIAIDKLFVDTGKLGFGVSLEFDKSRSLNGVKDISMDYKIIDDKGRVLMHYIPDTKPLVKNLNIINGTKKFVVNEDLKNGKYSFDMLLSSNENKIEIPKTLTFEIEAVNLFDTENRVTTIDGKWNIAVNIDEKFKNYKPIEFAGIDLPEMILINSAVLTPTSFNLDFTLKTHVDEGILLNMKLRDSKGNIYKPNDGMTLDEKDGMSTIKANFESSFYDSTDELTLVIDNVNGKTIEAKLIKK